MLYRNKNKYINLIYCLYLSFKIQPARDPAPPGLEPGRVYKKIGVLKTRLTR